MKEYFKSTIQYYLRHLKDNGCPDPIREVVTDFTKYMKKQITKEQREYIEKNTVKTVKDKRMIEDAIIILKTVKVNKESDKKVLVLIEEGLKSLL